MVSQGTLRGHGGVAIPLLVYGIAWKEERTAELTNTALTHGFGIAMALNAGVQREDLFIQPKFSPLWAYDKTKIPFNPDQIIEDQVKESIQQTFDHLNIDYLDVFFLHASFENEKDNLIAWKVFETFVPHKFRQLGVSNFSASQLRNLYDNVSVKPTFVQNPFTKQNAYDHTVRAFCLEHDITYQSFGMLKNNPEVLESEFVASFSQKLNVGKQLGLYILIFGLGDTQVLNGTTKVEHMELDVQKTAEVFGDRELLESLQPDFAEWRRLLVKLGASETSESTTQD